MIAISRPYKPVEFLPYSRLSRQRAQQRLAIWQANRIGHAVNIDQFQLSIRQASQSVHLCQAQRALSIII